jgi:myo-inositol 2-dehydrogenase / D-chiro-inositol 1-dehydrogenase
MTTELTRRSFLGNSAIAGAAIAAAPYILAQGTAGKKVKVALIGCGGRGTGALGDFLAACKILQIEPEVVATADAFLDKAVNTGKNHNVPAERCFGGYDGYQKVLQTDCQVILTAAPPGFRPVHFAAAIEAGKHVFMEKPVAVDPPGIRQVLAAGKAAAAKGLAVVAGTQRRHQKGYLENAAKIAAGAIGEIKGGVVQWNGTIPWIKRRENGWSNADYVTRNWLNFNELSGDHIVEQHVHNLDVALWFLGRPPVSALGFGGRTRRETGNMFDFFSVDLDFGNDVHIHSQCRQLSGAYGRVGELFTGTEGVCLGGGKIQGKDVSIPEVKVDADNPYVQEHVDLLRSVLASKPLNETEAVANSTMVAIMGRMSAYTGQMIRWSDVMENDKSEFFNYACKPSAKDFEKGDIEVPEEVVPVPGKA